MSHDFYYTVFLTPAGWMGLSGSAGGIRRVTLPRPSREEAVSLIAAADATENDEPFTDLIERFRAYFNGQEADFLDKLDLSEYTVFQREVWAAARAIPYGETRSYGWLAREIGRPRAARAVGQALGRNPCPVIVPCHRVLAGDGRLGGFSGGIGMKKHLLKLEGGLPEK